MHMYMDIQYVYNFIHYFDRECCGIGDGREGLYGCLFCTFSEQKANKYIVEWIYRVFDKHSIKKDDKIESSLSYFSVSERDRMCVANRGWLQNAAPQCSCF